MLRSHGSLIKWLLYTAAFFFFFFLERCVLNRFPICGCIPLLTPLCVIAAACFEGSLSGSIMGLAAGVLCALVYYRGGVLMVPCCTLLGLLAGTTTTKQVGKTITGVLLCCAAGMALLEGFRVWLQHVFQLIDLDTLLRIAVPEGLYSLPFALPVYGLFSLIYRKFRTDSEL